MRLLPTSLFGRMFALSLLATLAALAVAGVAIGGVLERFVTGGVDARLQDRLLAVSSAVGADGIDGAQLARIASRIAPDEPWRIDLPDGRVLGAADLVSFDRRGPRPPRPRNGARPFEGMAGGMRVHGLATVDGGVRVRVAVPRREIDRPVRAALVPLALSLAILGLALGGAALLQVRLGLRPLGRLREAVAAIRQGRATSVPADVPDEIAPLARELNALAVDTAAALAGARTSAANLAHALKTPVATLRLTLAGDVAAQAQLARIDATLRHHLGRARAIANRRAATPLAPALGDLAATIRRLHDDRVTIAVAAPADLAAAIDAQDLDELAGNLIDNAARHATARVAVTASADDRTVRLAVADDGPGIPAADRAVATAPGMRLDERGDGHGFGLAIARELAELHGGTLTLDESAEGGLLATVTLPRGG